MEHENEEVGAVMDALAHPLRRHALSVLADRDPPVGVRDVADAVRESMADGGVTVQSKALAGPAALEAAPGPSHGDAAERLAVELYHVHLPKLDDAGLVAFDHETRSVVDSRAPSLTERR